MNTEAGLQGGVQGAQIGAQFGGPYGAVIGGALGLGLGLFSKDTEKKAIEKFNQETVTNATKTLFDMRRVQNIQNIRTAQALSAYQDNAKVSKSTYNAAYGASDIIGASAEALSNTVALQTAQAMEGTWFNFDTEINNYNQNVESVTNQAMSQLKRAKAQGAGGGIGSMLTQAASLYGKFSGQGGAGSVGATGTGSIADGSYVPSGADSPAGLSNTLNFGM